MKLPKLIEFISIVIQISLTICLSGCSVSLPQAPQTEIQQPESESTTNEPRSTDVVEIPTGTSTVDHGNTVQRIPITRPDPHDANAESESTSATEENSSDGSSSDSSGSSDPPTSNPPSEPQSRTRKRKKIPDADATIKNIGKLVEKSRQAKGRNEIGNAFRLATEAWEATRLHPKDARLRKLAEELGVELKSLGDLANSKLATKAADSDTRLIDK